MQNEADLHYLQLLSKSYPTVESAGAEIMNLQAILDLPKGTEHFISDIHGEYGAFSHVLRNASGVIKGHIDRVFGDTLEHSEKKKLATLIYYPEKKLALLESTVADTDILYRDILHKMILMCRSISSKYTRSKVRKAMPQSYAYIIEELLHEDETSKDKHRYYDNIISTIIRLGMANDFICKLAHLIQRLAIYKLHVIGDIFDRGRDGAKIMDTLCEYHSVDIQWGNHDISWMGAAAGCRALVCNVIRIQARYGNLDALEEDYGINLVPLATFALNAYRDDPCTQFTPAGSDPLDGEAETALIAKMHKAITVIQFKCEAEIIKRNPDFKMNDRILLDKISGGKVTADGIEYSLNDTFFPTVSPDAPLELTGEERDVLEKLTVSFKNNEKLKKHVRFLFAHGSIYKAFNSNLMFHGCIPLNSDGDFKTVRFNGTYLFGKDYLDAAERAVRGGYFNRSDRIEQQKCLDFTWYLWCGPDSPLFGKDKMATFENYFIDDPAASTENRSTYYELRNIPEIIERILDNFGLDPETAHIVNGHVPVKVSSGEKPVKADGKLFVIDGGFAKAYQSVTGIAGYTLIYNSHGRILVSHDPFESEDAAVINEKDIHSSTVESQYSDKRIRVSDTDTGKEIKKQIADLEALLGAYNKGIIKESADKGR